MLGGGVGQWRDKTKTKPKTEQAQTNPRHTYVPHTLPHPKGQASAFLSPAHFLPSAQSGFQQSLSSASIYREQRPVPAGRRPSKNLGRSPGYHEVQFPGERDVWKAHRMWFLGLAPSGFLSPQPITFWSSNHPSLMARGGVTTK